LSPTGGTTSRTTTQSTQENAGQATAERADLASAASRECLHAHLLAGFPVHLMKLEDAETYEITRKC
jgi:hypothetical protein